MDEKALQRLADEIEIRNLVATVAHGADMAADLDDYLPCFTEDAVWEMNANAAENLPHAYTRGHAEIRADREQRRGDGFQGPGTHTRHVNTTLSVKVNDDGTAEAESYWLFVGDTDKTPVLRAIGHYRDSFRKTDDGWKMSHRRITNG